MRRKEFEVADIGEIAKILDGFDTVRVGISGADAPYIVPMSFGWAMEEGRICVYIHGARAGRRFSALGEGGRVCIEGDLCHGFIDTPDGGVTTQYESVIGWGDARLVTGADAEQGLRLLLAHCGFPDNEIDGRVASVTAVYRVPLDEISCKRRIFGK